MSVIILIILGLIGGSFLSAWLHRLRAGESVLHGRSQCPACHHQLAWLDLIPVVSWVMLKGKCRYCAQPISWQYPTLEIILAIMLALGSILTGWELVIYIAASVLLLAAAVYDWRWLELPDIISLFIGLVGIINVVHLAVIYGRNWWWPIVNALIAAVIALIFFGGQYLLSKGKWLGNGDILLGVGLALLLGWPGILLSLVIGYIIGSVVAVVLLTRRLKQWGSTLALGPFLALGAWVVLRWGGPLMMWLGWQ